MKIGYSLREITPQVGGLLAGYDCERTSTDVHDPLYCKVINLLTAKEKVCFVQFDVLCVGETFVSRVKEISSKYLFKEENVFVGAIHTHSGPKGTCSIDEKAAGIGGIFGEWDEQYVNQCLSAFEDCLRESEENLTEGKMKISYQDVEGICSERHSIDLPYDHKLWKIVLERKDNTNVLIYNYSCHPTILHDDNLKISADLPGSVARYLENDFDFVMFYNGSAGDISTRFTRKGSDFAEVDRLGRKLAEKILNRDEVLVYEGDAENLSIERKVYLLKARPRETVLAMKDYMEKMEGKPQYHEACVNYEFMRSIDYPNHHDKIDIDVTYVKINDIVIVMIPSEITSGLTLRLTQNYNCMIFGYVNGYHLYISGNDSFENRYYESSLSLFDKGEGERLINFIEENLKN